MDIWGDTKIDFLGKRKIAFAVSGALAFVGLIAVIAMATGKANLGTDFSGGISVQFKFEKPFEMDEMRKVLSEGNFGDADLQEISGTNRLIVKVGTEAAVVGGASTKMGKVFSQALPGNPFIIELATEVGPTVGDKLQKDALMAILVALLGILMYVAWRFEFRFGVASVVATFHDVLAVLGIIFIMNKEINLLIVTALLTLAGYSLTDTVVVFDRIRENLRRQGSDDLEPLINKSINEVLRRTIVTSGTTLLVLVALIVKGGDVIHDFSLTLFFGVLVGTYSSVFVASPVLLLWKGKKGRLIQE